MHSGPSRSAARSVLSLQRIVLCRILLRCVVLCWCSVVPIVKSGRFLQIKATYYNPKSKKTIHIIVVALCRNAL